MDSSTIGLITALGLAIIGNIAAWWQISIQRRKDNRDELQKLIDDQRGEIDRLRTRGTELEDKLIAKINENGDLKLASIDKEIELKTIRYKLADTETKLQAIYALQAKKEQLPVPSTPPEDIDSIVKSMLAIPKTEEAEDLDLLELVMDFPADSSEEELQKQAISEDVNAELGELEENSIRDL